jgi:ABC-2 type transport system permease protein
VHPGIIKRLRPIIIKEFRQIWRDPTSLGMLLVLPAALIILVGYALDFDVKHIPLVIFDQCKTAESRAFLEKFKETEYFDYLYEAASYSEVEELFMQGKAKAAVVTPTSFGRDLLAGRNTTVQILLDGSDANSAGQALAFASRMTMDYSTRMITQAWEVRGREPYLPISFRPRIWFNPDLASSRFLIPGLIGFIVVLTGVISTSLTVVREKERGTMEQIMVSPLRPLDIIMGKTIPYMFISIVAASLILLIGYLLFDVEVKGSILLLYGAIFTIVLGALGQGLLISTVTDSQQVAFMVSVFSSLLPSFLLSGFVFPVSSMPVVLQVFSNIAVNKFFLIVVRGIMIRGVGFSAVWEQFVFMIIFALVMLTIGTRRMVKRSV